MSRLFAFLLVVPLLATVPPTHACNALLVGKQASRDGAVLFGHLEQNSGDRILNFRCVPRRTHAPGSIVRLRNGGTLPQVEETWAFLWSQNPGLRFSDSYLNEWGVAVASNACPTREDSFEELVKRGEIVDGGIDIMLRRLVVERARSAREGVRIAGALLDRFGYTDSGRTLVIADPDEAWLLAIVRGKHWVAQRVPDDAVVLLPNVHIIGEVDLDDPDHFLGSPDLIDYAIRRGWYDPGSGPFRFRSAYNVPEQDRIDVRQWRAQCLVLGRAIPMQDRQQLPFAVRLDRKLDVSDVVRVLRDHGDEQGQGALCSARTQEAAVFQLRTGMPREIGCVYWRTTAEPCTSVLLPWYAGLTQTPAGYVRPVGLEEQLGLEYQLNPPAGTFTPAPDSEWWRFRTLQECVNQDRARRLGAARAVWDALEDRIFAGQEEVEARARALLAEDPDRGRTFLTSHCAALAKEASSAAKGLIERFEGER